MDMLKLAEEIIAGRRLTRQDDLQAFLTCDLHELCQGADKIRAACVGDHVDLCSIINGRSGKCPENCKFCAQSAHNHTECQSHPMLSTEEILAAARMNENEGVHRFSIVTAGRALTGKEFDAAIEAYKTMSKECNIELCASMGFLDEDQLRRLKEAGVTSYHHNIETSKRNFPNICTTHTYDMKTATLKLVKEIGMCACAGGIIGMGETWEDLRTVAFFRYINPEANIRLGAGRALLTNDGETAFRAGASATITGNMLTTTACATIRSDRNMLTDMGRDITPPYQVQ